MLAMFNQYNATIQFFNALKQMLWKRSCICRFWQQVVPWTKRGCLFGNGIKLWRSGVSLEHPHRDSLQVTKWAYPTSIQRAGSHLERVEHTTVDGVCGEQESQYVREDSLSHMVLGSTTSGPSSQKDRLGCVVEGILPYSRLPTHPQHPRVIGRIVHQLHGQQLEAVLTPVK
jgi:hypothetical protein